MKILNHIGGIGGRAALLAGVWTLLPPAAFPERPAPATTYAFRDVTVIPMTGPRRLDHHTVVVTGDRITSVEPADSVAIPPGATIIDGTGRYLMPGLADMHVHLPGFDSSGVVTRDVLTLFVANGVTTIRVMSGTARHLAVRDSINRGELLGPRMYVAGSSVGALPGYTADLRRVLTLAEVTRFASEMKRAGYDYIQVTSGIMRSEYEGLTNAARRVGIPLTGGVPNDPGLDRVIRARPASIENLEGYLQALERDDSPIRYADPVTRSRRLARYYDPAKVRRLAAEIRDAGIANTPTLFLAHVTYTGLEPAQMAQWPEMRYVAQPVLADWMRRREQAMALLGDPEDATRLLLFRNVLTKELVDAGARVLVGSDAPSTFLVPGFATLYEIHSFTVAGLSVAQSLHAATRAAAEFVGAEQEFGSVAPGLVADLVLLDENPLVDVGNLTDRAGVMVRGRWLPAEELGAMLDGVAASNGVGNARVRDR